MQSESAFTQITPVKTFVCLLKEIALYPIYEPSSGNKYLQVHQARSLKLRKRRISNLQTRLSKEIKEYWRDRHSVQIEQKEEQTKIIQ